MSKISPTPKKASSPYLPYQALHASILSDRHQVFVPKSQACIGMTRVGTICASGLALTEICFIIQGFLRWFRWIIIFLVRGNQGTCRLARALPKNGTIEPSL